MLSLHEIIDLVIMTAALGYIFKDTFQREEYHGYDPLKALKHITHSTEWQDFKFAALITAPAIIFHEMSHKFVALGFGLQATFHASYQFLGLGIFLKLINFPFIFFVPGYVSHSGAATYLQSAMISGAGPFMNLALWLGCYGLLQSKLFTKKYKKWHNAIFLSSKINQFLFVFNMLPIPGFDGAQFYISLYHAIFG